MKITHKTLYKTLKEIDFSVINKTSNLLLEKTMFEFMQKQQGIGLAANQVGQEKRMFVMNVNGPKACYNPEIISESDAHNISLEGCLSFKGEYESIDRPDTIMVKYQNWEGKEIFEELSGLEARCFLHELDHLNGITMFKRKKLNEFIGTV